MSAFTLDTSGEDWRAVVGYEGLYEVSNLARVRGIDRTITRHGRHVRLQGLVMRQRLNIKTRYVQVNLSRGGKQTALSIHRLVAAAFLPNPDGKPDVNHIDNTPTNNVLENLEWCTVLENRAHAGRQMRLRGHLTRADVLAIRAAYAKAPYGKRQLIAKQYGIGARHAWKIATGRAHQHVEVLP